MGPSEYIYFYDHEKNQNIRTGNWALPVKQVFDSGELKKSKTFWIQSLCDFYWICFNEKREAWISAFHDQDMPEGYTAKPA